MTGKAHSCKTVKPITQYLADIPLHIQHSASKYLSNSNGLRTFENGLRK
jgi:hypothetical protein